MANFMARRVVQNEEMLARIRASAPPVAMVQRAFDEKGNEEIRTGKAVPVSMERASAEAVVTPRFPADEGSKLKCGVNVRKVRCIDDFSASTVNALASVGEAIKHDSLDVLVALYRGLGRSFRKLRFRKDDFVGAFKTLPLCAEHLHLAVAAWMSEDGVRVLQLLAAPFGALSSVHAWHRLGAAVQRILASLFVVPYPRYVDDLFGLDPVLASSCRRGELLGPQGTANLARFVISDLLAWELDEDKAVTDAKSCVVLGVAVAVDDEQNRRSLCQQATKLAGPDLRVPPGEPHEPHAE